MLFLRCIKERGYILRGAEIVAQYVDGSSSNVPVTCLELVPFDRTLDRWHVYRQLDYWTKVTILERRIMSRGDSCCFNNCLCVDIYAIPLLVRWGLFVAVPDRLCFCEGSRLLFVPTPILMA